MPVRGPVLAPADTAPERLLVDYFENFLRDRDIEQFRQKVTSRFNEAALLQALRAPESQSRRAAAVALGLVGTMNANDALARSLADADPLVRRLAHGALWNLWFRADTPENNAELQRVAERIARDQYKEAEERATRLITRAPRLAEAYNQRAIAEFLQGRYADSARDCRRVLELNPVHTGALSGLGQCYVRMGQRREALEVYRRALELDPHNEALRALVAELSGSDA